MKSLKLLFLIAAIAYSLLGTATAKVSAASYSILYNSFVNAECTVNTGAGLPYFDYFNVAITENVPQGAKIHTYTYINGTLTTNTWTVTPAAYSGTSYMERIDSTTPNFVGRKFIDLWVNGKLTSRTEIEGKCNRKVYGEWGPYGAIVLAKVY
jgi:hypothetical protein